MTYFETNTRTQVQLWRPMGQVPDPTFPQTSRFSPDSLSGAALKFSSASRPPFTEAATGASVNLGGHSQETEVGGTQAVAE